MGELYTNCNWPNSLLPLIKPALQQREQVSLSEFKGKSVGVDSMVDRQHCGFTHRPSSVFI
jgi:hypothetical protein